MNSCNESFKFNKISKNEELMDYQKSGYPVKGVFKKKPVGCCTKSNKSGTLTPIREAVDPAKYIVLHEVDGTKYACSKCGNVYKWRKSLNKHWKEKHDGEIPDLCKSITPLVVPKLRVGNKHLQTIHNLQSDASADNDCTFNYSDIFASTPSNTKSMYQLTNLPLQIMDKKTKSVSGKSSDESLSNILCGTTHTFNKNQTESKTSEFWKPEKYRYDNLWEIPNSPNNVANSNNIRNAQHENSSDKIKKKHSDVYIPIDLSGQMNNINSSDATYESKPHVMEKQIYDELNHIKAIQEKPIDLSKKAISLNDKVNPVLAEHEIFTCFICRCTFYYASDLNSHFHIVHLNEIENFQPISKQNNACLVCGVLCSSFIVLAQHFAEHHSILPNPYETILESIKMRNNDNFDFVKQIGSSDKVLLPSTYGIPYFDSDKDKKYHKFQQRSSDFKNSGLESGEQQTVSTQNSLTTLQKCEICDYQARWPSEMQQHLKNHSDEKPYQCQTCTYRSKWKWDVAKHSKKCYLSRFSHKNENMLNYEDQSLSIESVPNTGPPNVFVQKQLFVKNSNDAKCAELMVQLESENDNEVNEFNDAVEYTKPYICTICSYASKWKCDLKKHIRTYSHYDYLQMNDNCSILHSNELDGNNGQTNEEIISMNKLKCKKCCFCTSDLSVFIKHQHEHSSSDIMIKYAQSEKLDDVSSTVSQTMLLCNNTVQLPYSSKRHRKQEKYKILKAETLSDNNILKRSSDTFAKMNNMEWFSNSKLIENFNENVDETLVIEKAQPEEIHEKSIIGERELCLNVDLNNFSMGRNVSKKQKDNSIIKTKGTKKRRKLKSCTKCAYVTDNITTLQRHMAKHGGTGRFSCNYCDYTVNKQHVAETHMRYVHLENGQTSNDFSSKNTSVMLTESNEMDNSIYAFNSISRNNSNDIYKHGSLNTSVPSNVCDYNQNKIKMDSLKSGKKLHMYRRVIMKNKRQSLKKYFLKRQLCQRKQRKSSVFSKKYKC